MYYIALFPDENSTSVGNGDRAAAYSVTMATFIQSLMYFTGFGERYRFIFKNCGVNEGLQAVCMYPPELFVCSWEKVSGRHVLSTSVACFWSCIVCRRSPDLGLLSSSGEIFLYLVFTFFSFIVSRMNAGLTNWNLI